MAVGRLMALAVGSLGNVGQDWSVDFTLKLKLSHVFLRKWLTGIF